MQSSVVLFEAIQALACGAAEAPSFVDRLGRLGGRLHPLAVHFPIALIAAACLIELWRGVRRKGQVSPTGLLCLGIGALGACAAAGSGWLNASYESVTSGTAEIHRWVGVAVAGMAVALTACGLVIRNAQVGVRAYRLGLVVAAGLVAYGGHLGGALTHGETYVTDALRGVFSPRKPQVMALTPTTPMPATLEEIRFPADGKIDFNRDVKPIFVLSCVECHGEKKRKGALRMDVKAAALEGGKGGPLYIPGKPDESQLIIRVLGLGDEQRMPADKDPLPEECIRILKAWVEQGANWPDDGLSKDHGEEEKHWAYVKPVRRDPPPAGTWGRNQIDGFILAAMKAKGLEPSPEAERGMLLRRVTLDLTGLPPTVEEVDAFVRDERSGAYERVVDRLLASPRYGEHMARTWLDLARYADSNGYEKDGGRSIWPYRDWVIAAFNEDMPYDRFTLEQLAGDLLPDPKESQLIATGFHRNSMINEEGGVDPEEYRVNAVVDRVNTTATVWLGQTVACAQCHDHKYDPVSIQEYYRFFAFFNDAAAESRLAAGSEFQEISPKLTLRDGHDEQRGQINRLEELIRAAGEKAEGVEERKRELEALRRQTPQPVTTLVMRDEASPRDTRVLLRGSFLSPGERVEPGVPAAFGKLTSEGRANRATLARWLTDGDNPLTARVAVNRVWEHHFGRGLVETSEDFGTRGSPPSHPELLDFMAVEFVQQKWSLKAMHRLVVTSATYRQLSRVTPELLEKDPGNVWLARGPRQRLAGETIRDQALAVSGLLASTMGGPPVFPVQPEGIWQNPYSDNTWRTSEGEGRYRRSIYTFWKRSSPYPSFVAFDAPSRQVTCTRRARTNTPLQALTTLNDPVFIEAAAAFAARIITSAGPGVRERIEFAVKACLARSPDGAEQARLVALYEQMIEAYRRDTDSAIALVEGVSPARASGLDPAELAAWTIVANVLLNLDEVLNRG
ncbi:MAG: DUF1553 domain-containing protein [Phycisphaeraceae bacterium]|nr:DUF1553 domain-containing protein [Phycisphaeraceae bacterium]